MTVVFSRSSQIEMSASGNNIMCLLIYWVMGEDLGFNVSPSEADRV